MNEQWIEAPRIEGNQELAAQGIEVPIQLGSTCNACADGEACE